MDLYAYSQIESLAEIAEQNGIEVPRLRGYRLMGEEEKVSAEEMERVINRHTLYICEHACCSEPRFRPESCVSEYSMATERLKRKYCIYKKVTEIYNGEPYTTDVVCGFRWDLLHGKNRKAVKFAIKNRVKAIKRNIEVFNKYVGRDDVLYIRARLGGDNWNYCRGYEFESKPWFLEKVDDYWDSTYCDIYAKIEKQNNNF